MLKGNKYDKENLKRRFEIVMKEYILIVESSLRGKTKLEDSIIQDIVAKIMAKAGEAKKDG